MDGENEKTVAIKFCFIAGLVRHKHYYWCKRLMGLKLWTDQRWYSRFWDGRELVEDDERGGRPKWTRTGVNIATVADLVKK